MVKLNNLKIGVGLMHPITIIEILLAIGIVAVLLVIAFLLPRNIRKISLTVVLCVALAESAFFAVRPFWIDYHIGIKIEQLNEHLEKKYPGEDWEISRRTSRNYNPYHLEVRFDNEKGWVYTYSVNKNEIKQVAIGVPDYQLDNEGKHYEGLGD